MAVEFTHYGKIHGFIPIYIGFDGDGEPVLGAGSYRVSCIMYVIEAFIIVSEFFGMTFENMDIEVTGRIEDKKT